MSEIDDLFALARRAAAPPAGAKERVLSRVLASVPPGPGGSGGGGAAAAPLPGLAGGGAALAGALVFALAALLGGGLYVARTQRGPEAEPSTEVTSPAVTTTTLVVTPPPASTPTEIVDLDSPRPTRPAPSVATDSLAEELALIRSAQSALGSGNPTGALSILDQHAKRFPRGKLGQEREVTRVRALCRGGRLGEAQNLYRALAKGAPSSPHLASLRASCPGLTED
jgi:hypothetical protein